MNLNSCRQMKLQPFQVPVAMNQLYHFQICFTDHDFSSFRSTHYLIQPQIAYRGAQSIGEASNSFQPGLLLQYLTAVALISSLAKKNKHRFCVEFFKKLPSSQQLHFYGSSHLQSFVEAAKNCLIPVAFHNTLKQPLLCRPRLCG